MPELAKRATAFELRPPIAAQPRARRRVCRFWHSASTRTPACAVQTSPETPFSTF